MCVLCPIGPTLLACLHETAITALTQVSRQSLSVSAHEGLNHKE